MNKMINPSDSVGKQHGRKSGSSRKGRVTFADVAGVDAAKLELGEEPPPPHLSHAT